MQKSHGVIAIREEEKLISGKEMFVEYITQRINKESEVDSYEDNETMFTGMEIPKKNNEDTQGISMGANRYEAKIKSIVISHDRMRTPDEPLTESEFSIFRT